MTYTTQSISSFSKNDEAVLVSNEPCVYTISNYISNDDCDHIINISKDKIHPALVSGDKAGYVSDGRSGQNYWLKHNTDNVTTRVSNKISELLNVPLENAEAFQVIYYSVNQEYRQHYDGWEFDGGEKSRRNMKFGGQRIWTALCYLNDVDAGGGTKFIKLDKEVNAEKGKLLVFSNVYSNSNKKHILSEHAGLPVIKGEKWAFNLWFREKSRLVLYDYPSNTNSPNTSNELYNDMLSNYTNKLKKENLDGVTLDGVTLDGVNLSGIYQGDVTTTKYNVISNSNTSKSNITFHKDILNNDIIYDILKLSKFDDINRSSCWIRNDKCKELINRISELVGINSCFYENISITNYMAGTVHNDHLDAYDLDSEKGKKYTNLLGQRLMTITGFLSDTIVNFEKLNEIYQCSCGSVLFYNNCLGESNIRDLNYIKSYKSVNTKTDMILFNIYVREKSMTSSNILKINNDVKTVQTEPDKPKDALVQLDYPKIINDIYEKPLLDMLHVPDFKINNKAPVQYTTYTLNTIKGYRESDGFLNAENLSVDYTIDEFNPVVVENVITPNIHKIVDFYFKKNIENGVYPLGDKQANRYKIINEILTRLLHLEFLPLIERITGNKMEATYTYLSAYLKGTCLPAHTDRADCQYTCSYIIGKPVDSSWNIYVHKKKQPIKHKGRYDFTPPKDECIPVDCNENGLMIFCGTDHIHFREELEAEYYNIVLLHYREKETPTPTPTIAPP